MTREDIIRMVEESGADFEGCYWTATAANLERFAALVAAHEREACAKLCGDLHLEGEDNTGLAADLIIARGQT